MLFICSFPILHFTILKAALAMKQGNVNLAAQKKAVRLFFPSFILVEICVKLTFSMPDGQKSGFFCYALRVEKRSVEEFLREL